MERRSCENVSVRRRSLGMETNVFFPEGADGTAEIAEEVFAGRLANL